MEETLRDDMANKTNKSSNIFPDLLSQLKPSYICHDRFEDFVLVHRLLI